ncbi:MAG: cobalamin biosynthesis protein [Clostridia bacterium]|nr:cobalamin biosynthesis protein [Clostridia bacterium]
MDELFSTVDALVFVGACGIAVRAIAPHIRSKATDPAVIVADELGKHAISLLSGHIGGANALARRIASAIGAEPVITTATDVNRRFAADEWAARNGLEIASMQAARKFAAEILKRDLPLKCDFPIRGELPGGLFPGEGGGCGLLISCREDKPFDLTLHLIPRILHIGIGCKRGTPAEQIRAAADIALRGISRRAIASAASIDVKADEAGLLAFCAEEKLPIRFYSAEELRAVEGDFSASAFVQGAVGVDNVCERAAMLDAGGGASLIIRKTCAGGVTIALAQEKWSACFE